MTLATVGLMITVFFVGTYLSMIWFVKDYMFRKVASLAYCYILGVFDVIWHCFINSELPVFWCGIFLISFGFVESVSFVVKTLTKETENE